MEKRLCFDNQKSYAIVIEKTGRIDGNRQKQKTKREKERKKDIEMKKNKKTIKQCR